MSLLPILLMLIGTSASAQFSEGDTEGKSQLKVLGKSWSSTFYSLASMESDKANDQGGRISSYNYFSFHTFLEGDWRFSLRLPFTYGTAGTDRYNGDKSNPQELELQDFILEVRNPEFMFLPWDIGLYWAGRVYTPNSKFSKQSGQIARFRNHFILSKVFNKYFETNIEQRAYYFWQSRSTYKTSFQDEYGFDVNATALTKRAELEHWFSVWGKITPKTGLGVIAVFEDRFWNNSVAENKSKPPERILSVGPQVRFSLTDSMNFIFNYGDRVNREENMNELGQFRAKNTYFTLHSFISL